MSFTDVLSQRATWAAGAVLPALKCLTLAAFMVFATASQPALAQATAASPASAARPAAAAAPRVRLTTTQGDIVLELASDKAPKTVENFLQYVRDKHYDGLMFHRVIDGFMVQAGGYDQRFAERSTRAPVPHEGREALARGGLRNVVGTVAMARTSDPNSASAQFFINVADNAFLDHTAPTPQGWGYTVFGRVVEGMDVVNRIKSLPTGAGGPFPRDVPRTAVIITSATLVNTP